jgi:O-succinylbenzoic acid--CoA ligase
MVRVVALALPAGPAYLDAIERVWAAGDAIAPLDYRLPPGEAAKVMKALAPAAVIEADGELRSLHGGSPLEPGDAAVIATSGTTGEPKAVIHTHASIEASALATSSALDVDPSTDRWLACLPLAHIGGLAVVMRALVTGTPVELHHRFAPETTIDAAHRGATLVSLVTRALNQVPAELFRTILIGGAAPPPDRPANVIATYGMTETGSGVVYDRQPLDGVEIDIDAGGEIRLRGPMLFRRYRHDPDPFDSGGWFATGDLGRWGDDGRLVVDGRRGDVIVTGGEKVWPAPIEAMLADRDDIAEVALVGRADPDWGHRVVAVAVPADPASPPTLAALRSATKERFPAWCAPRSLELRQALPKTSLGKVRRDLLA